MQSDMSYTYENLGFNPEEKEKIEKRMDKEFINEYIKYIQARNEFNTTKHTKAELKQKVLDYAVQANVTKEESEEIREIEEKLQEESEKVDMVKEGFDLNKSESYKDNPELDDSLDVKQIQARVSRYNYRGFEGKATKHVYSFQFEQKGAKQELIFAKIPDLQEELLQGQKAKKDKPAYDNDVITGHAILSLIEPQPKYYSHSVMSKVGLPKENLQQSNKKNKSFNMFFPVSFEKQQSYSEDLFLQNSKTDRLSHFDLNKFFNLHGIGFDHYIDLSASLNIKKQDKDLSTSLNIKKQDKEEIIRELKKLTCVTPQLIELSVKQHLRAIGETDEKVLGIQVKKAIEYYNIALKTLASYEEILDGKDSKYKDYLDNLMIAEKESYYNLFKKNVKKLHQEEKDVISGIVKDNTLKEKLQNSILAFDKYLENAAKPEAICNELYEKRLAEKLFKEKEKANQIAEEHERERIKEQIKSAINQHLGKPKDKQKKLYWDRDGKDGKLLNKRFFLKENARYIRKINNYYDKMCKEGHQNNLKELQELLNLAQHEPYRPISARY